MIELISLVSLALTVALIWFLISLLRGSPPRFCTACGHTSKPKVRTRGNVVVEIILWLPFIIPGVIYSIWRHATRGEVCPSCGAANLIPPNSPVAQKLRRDLGL